MSAPANTSGRAIPGTGPVPEEVDGSVLQQPMNRQQAASAEQLQRAIQQLEQATRDMGNSASSRQSGQQGGQAQSEAQKAAERLKQAV